MDLMMEAAIVAKLGPTSGPTEKYFARFEAYFNSLDSETKSQILKNASVALDVLSVEDSLVEEFRDATREFFRQFMSKPNSFQRGDYLELARLVTVNPFTAE